MKINSVLIDGYKCFECGEFLGFEEIKRLNIIIGKNNTGKSSLIDLLTIITDSMRFHNVSKEFNEIIVGCEIDEDIIKEVYLDSHYSQIDGGQKISDLGYAQTFVGKTLYTKIIQDSSYSQGRITGKFAVELADEDFPASAELFWSRLSAKQVSKLSEFQVVRLGAERNIVPEKEKNDNIKFSELKETGVNATNIIHKFINHNELDSKLVEKELLSSLNDILHPDTFFTDIVVQQIQVGQLATDLYWEIYLEEKEKGRIALSKSGSGLKTIILVLIEFLLMPVIKNKDTEKLIFALEEIENNIHPALQKSLFRFIDTWSRENNTTVFLTTHSHIPINMFSGSDDAQIIHVRKQEGKIIPKRTLNFQDSSDILFDLDVKASDILQSNGIIWVEGPSDKIYINKWIDLYSDGVLKEGLHYQVVYYGGKLLSHYSYDESFSQEDFINLLLTNRNCAILMDSDMKSEGETVGDTKQRIIEEFERNDAFAWVTEGREIENYIPVSVLRELHPNTLPFGLYQDIKDYLNEIEEGLGKKFEKNKGPFARRIIPKLTKENLDETLNIKENVNKLIEQIQKWNG